MFMRAAENAREWSKAEQKGEQLPITGRIAHAFYEQVVYKKIRTIFGPNADFAITGGAPMDSELSHFFNGIGMPVLEGYGMTETCGPVCVSLPEDNRIGTIGMPMVRHHRRHCRGRRAGGQRTAGVQGLPQQP
jgi:long-chain acyl-CoA synthetase